MTTNERLRFDPMFVRKPGFYWVRWLSRGYHQDHLSEWQVAEYRLAEYGKASRYCWKRTGSDEGYTEQDVGVVGPFNDPPVEGESHVINPPVEGVDYVANKVSNPGCDDCDGGL